MTFSIPNSTYTPSVVLQEQISQLEAHVEALTHRDNDVSAWSTKYHATNAMSSHKRRKQRRSQPSAADLHHFSVQLRRQRNEGTCEIYLISHNNAPNICKNQRKLKVCYYH
ncbi:unnamed protein product [Clavelina lepadiformis]|uniref:Uncharacterized protein n=1 Tax=Clavelina lepadiformis TaxID=159417 RepID=A0ABP0H1G4_CLALP